MDEQRAGAWARGYALVAGIVDRGVMRDDLVSLETDPELWATVPKVDGTVDLPTLGADHYDLFERQVFASEGVFVHEPALVGAASNALVDLYEAHGVQRRGDAPDRLHTLLFALATLAQTNDETGTRALLGQHLLTWIAPVSVALGAHADDFHRQLVDLMLALIADQVRTLRIECLPGPHASDESAGISDTLLTPLRAGALVTQRTLSTIARALELPSGFGSRRQALINLLRSASDFERTPELLGTLAGHFDEVGEGYARFATRWPALGDSTAVWRDRAADTARRLRATRAAYLDGTPPEETEE